MSSATHPARIRFDIQIRSLNELLSATSKAKDKGLAFYTGGGRSILFRLEALCRIYRDIHDKRIFGEWYKIFKQVEDQMGRMDYLESMQKEFNAYPSFRKETAVRLKKPFDEESAGLGRLLISGDWYNGKRLASLESQLSKISWEENSADRESFCSVVANELDKLTDKYAHGEINLQFMEKGLHEFRRRLRWVSIYAQVANGLIQLRPSAHLPEPLRKYATREIVTSPFNKMPRQVKGVESVHIQSGYYYALSWLIWYLGELKDIGLRYQMFVVLDQAAATTDPSRLKKFNASCTFPPHAIFDLAEEAVDLFIYHDLIPERIVRDILRSLQSGLLPR